MPEYSRPQAEGTEEHERLPKDREKNRKDNSPGEITVDAAASVALEEISVRIDRKGGEEGGEDGAAKQGKEALAEEKETVAVNRETDLAVSAVNQEKLAAFKKRLASYYQVGEAYVEIRMEAGKEPDTGQGKVVDSGD